MVYLDDALINVSTLSGPLILLTLGFATEFNFLIYLLNLISYWKEKKWMRGRTIRNNRRR